MERLLTKIPMRQQQTVRLLPNETAIVLEAARLQGISRSEFLRRSVTEKARRIIQKSQREERVQ